MTQCFAQRRGGTPGAATARADGIIAAALISLLAFGERLGPIQLTCIAMVLVGAVGLKLTTTH